MLGPQGMTWFIVGVSVASFIAFLILVAIIWCIVAFCRKRKKVRSVDGERHHSDSSSNKGDETPDSAMRLPGHGKSNNDMTRNLADISVNVPPPYGHSSSANPNDLTMLTNSKDVPK